MIEELLKDIADSLKQIAKGVTDQTAILKAGGYSPAAPEPAAEAPAPAATGKGKGKKPEPLKVVEPEPEPVAAATVETEDEDEGPVVTNEEVRASFAAATKVDAKKANEVYKTFFEAGKVEKLSQLDNAQRTELKAIFDALIAEAAMG